MSILSKGCLLFNTIKYLKPSQVVNQVIFRLRRPEQFQKYICSGIKYKEFNLWIDKLDNNPIVLERFLPEQLLNNKITLLNETRVFDKWDYEDASHLWNYNLHYLEYLVPLFSLWKSTNDEKYKEKINIIFNDWYENGSMKADSNQSYTISLRIVNMLIISEAVEDKQKLYESIYAQYRYLLKHQEKHLLGNHYLENLKAIVICSVVFGEEDIYNAYIGKLLNELDEEITDDGLHFELSLMYHKIVLEDIIRVALVLKEAKKPDYQKILDYIKKMATALYSLEHGIDRTLLFNDAGDNIAKPTSSLLKICKQFGVEMENKDCIAGYYKLYDGKIMIIIDCGELSPLYMPGHAHCDCLSFELFYDRKPIFVNSGTYQYQGDKRAYFRSTRAHNTVMINGHEQSQCWGEHRVAKRVYNVKGHVESNCFKGECVSYVGEKHEREIELKEDEIIVYDYIIDGNKAESYLHISSEYALTDKLDIIDSNNTIIGTVSGINCKAEIVREGELAWQSTEFGKIRNGVCIRFIYETDIDEKRGYKLSFT